jgi:hypothetical protein
MIGLRKPLMHAVCVVHANLGGAVIELRSRTVFVIWALFIVSMLITACSREIPPSTTFVLSATPPFLSEGIALQCASNFLKQVHPEAQWKALTYSSTKAPDGVSDSCLLRNHIDPSRGTIHFVAMSNRLDRVVAVSLHGNSIRCELWRSK